MDERGLRFTLLAGALLTAGLCIWSSLTHEPDVSTLEFDNDSDSRSMTSDSLSYYMVFTGDLADTVSWDFGDGTSAEAFLVYKTYDSPGTYSILCKASNDNGDRYSGYTLEITEAEERGLLDGYGSEVLLLLVSAGLFVAYLMIGRPPINGRGDA